MADRVCRHREDRLQPAMLNDDALYCPDCSSLVFDDGHVESVQITGMRETTR